MLPSGARKQCCNAERVCLSCRREHFAPGQHKRTRKQKFFSCKGHESVRARVRAHSRQPSFRVSSEFLRWKPST